MKKNKINFKGRLSELFSFNISLPLSSITALIPKGLFPDNTNELGFLSLMVGTITSFRPAKIRFLSGINYRFAIYRISVKKDKDETGNIFSYFYKIFMSHPLPAVIGNMGTTFHFDTAHIDCHRIGGQIVISIDVPHETKYHFSCHGEIAQKQIEQPKNSVFQSLENNIHYFSSLSNVLVWNPKLSRFDQFNTNFIGSPLPIKLDDFDFPWICNIAEKEKWKIESATYMEGKDFNWNWWS